MCDPLSDADTLAQAVKMGIMDAPHLRNNRFARGEVRTAFVHGTCVAVDMDGKPVGEMDRLGALR